MRTIAETWSGKLRLVLVVFGGAALLTAWVLHQDGSSWATRFWGALLVAFAPVLAAWPWLARPARRRRPGTRLIRAWHIRRIDEVDLLRRAGAI